MNRNGCQCLRMIDALWGSNMLNAAWLLLVLQDWNTRWSISFGVLPTIVRKNWWLAGRQSFFFEYMHGRTPLWTSQQLGRVHPQPYGVSTWCGRWAVILTYLGMRGPGDCWVAGSGLINFSILCFRKALSALCGFHRRHPGWQAVAVIEAQRHVTDPLKIAIYCIVA